MLDNPLLPQRIGFMSISHPRSTFKKRSAQSGRRRTDCPHQSIFAHKVREGICGQRRVSLQRPVGSFEACDPQH